MNCFKARMFSFVLALSVSLTTVYAGVVSDKLQRDEYGAYLSGDYYQADSGKLNEYTNRIFEKMGVRGVSISYLTNGVSIIDGKVYLSDEQLAVLDDVEGQCEAWVDASVPVILPQGTPAEDAPMMVANWVSDRMTYDESQLGLRSSQTALHCYATGKGVCVAYSRAFNQILASAPINPETGLIDYTCPYPVFYETRTVDGYSHEWSAVNIGGEWKEFDILWYDNNDRERDNTYVNVSMCHMPNDGAHDYKGSYWI